MLNQDLDNRLDFCDKFRILLATTYGTESAVVPSYAFGEGAPIVFVFGDHDDEPLEQLHTRNDQRNEFWDGHTPCILGLSG